MVGVAVGGGTRTLVALQPRAPQPGAVRRRLRRCPRNSLFGRDGLHRRQPHRWVDQATEAAALAEAGSATEAMAAPRVAAGSVGTVVVADTST